MATVLGAAVAAVGALAISEGLHWRASRSARPMGAVEGSCGLVILGYRPKRDGSAHPVQRWRVNIAARSANGSPVARIVVSGGPHGDGPSEAEVMADYARSIGIDGDLLVLEERATTTGENVDFSIPMVKECDTIAFCSDPMHAARARRHALQRRPELEGCLVGADDYRILEQWWLKLPAAAYELTIGFQTRRRARKKALRRGCSANQ